MILCGRRLISPSLMRTSLQTAHVRFSNSSLVFNTLELVPVKPENVFNEKDSVYISKDDGTVVGWHVDGSVTQEESDGKYTVWYPPPTLNDAIEYPTNAGFFKFNKDGSVEAHWYESNYYWSAPTYEVEPVKGTQILRCVSCGVDNSDGLCDSCGCGGYYYRYSYNA